MNPFLFSIVALCLATTGAIAQYGSAPQYASGHSQRKMAPSPQSYGANMGYGEQQQQYGNEMSSYEQQAPQGYGAPASYKAPSSAHVSAYDERTPAQGKQQQSYARPAQQASYAAPAAASSYAKPAAKYEEQYHAPMPFAWGYDINDGYGGAQYHKETGDEYGKRTGSYGYTDAYGIYRQVDYVADEHGFRATIKTNEPGTANESPADVELHAYEPPSNYYAGNTNSHGSGYGAQQQQQQSYGKAAGKQQSSYSAPASYGQQQQSSYGQQRSSYGKQQSSYQQAPARQSYHQQQQEQQSYSSSAMVPVFTKAAAPVAVAVPAKKY